MTVSPKSLPRTVLAAFLLVTLAAAAVLVWGLPWSRKPDAVGRGAQPVAFQALAPDPLDGGVAWVNTGGPIRLRDLKGKIVLLDFWTFCCINCHHVLPDLAKLEEKYKNQLVVIGVHTPKFIAERDTSNLRQKVREYGIKHPVVNDADQVIWNQFGVNSWPTLVLIDPEGKPVGSISGEGHYATLDEAIGKLVANFRAKKELNEEPFKFFPENEKPDDTPLLYPGKVLADADGDRLFIADTGHNRVVMTDLKGRHPVAIGDGSTGLHDGSFEKAQFHRPQGLALLGETLYVADTENHAIRAVDLKAKTVTTAAGNGEQARAISRPRGHTPAHKTALSSPWDLAHVPDSRVLYVAMAGPHQIWRFDTEAGQIGPWAGTGVENIVDGPIATANFAQPSGLATDGTHLFVADSEVSAVREISLGAGPHLVKSVVGQGLFEFGDEDGRGGEVRLQHCLGVAYGDGRLFIADTYNNKVKVCDPRARSVKTFAGDGRPGDRDDPAEFYQPGGLSVAGETLYVADTNNHKVRLVDLASGKVSTLELASMTPPEPRPRKPFFPNAAKIDAPAATIAPGRSLTLDVTLPIPDGYKLNDEGSMPVLVEAPVTPGLIDEARMPRTGIKLDKPARSFSVDVPLAVRVSDGDSFNLKVSVSSFVCSEGSSLCTIKSYVWSVRVDVADGGASFIALKGQDR